ICHFLRYSEFDQVRIGAYESLFVRPCFCFSGDLLYCASTVIGCLVEHDSDCHCYQSPFLYRSCQYSYVYSLTILKENRKLQKRESVTLVSSFAARHYNSSSSRNSSANSAGIASTRDSAICSGVTLIF